MQNGMHDAIKAVRHGLLLAILALVLGIGWAGYLALNHETLHGNFEKQEQAHHADARTPHMPPYSTLLDAVIPAARAHGDAPAAHAGTSDVPHGDAGHARQHSHSGSLATDAMQRLLRGHIHWMGLGILSMVLLLVVAFTSLRPCIKGLLGWTFGLGALLYPLAWVLMGFRTVRLGPEAAEESVLWLFGPAAGLILASLIAVFCIIAIEMFGLQRRIPLCSRLFSDT